MPRPTAGALLDAALQALAMIRDGRVEAGGMDVREYARLYLEISPDAAKRAIEHDREVHGLLKRFAIGKRDDGTGMLMSWGDFTFEAKLALAEVPAGPLASCGHTKHPRGFGCTHDGCANDDRQFATNADTACRIKGCACKAFDYELGEHPGVCNVVGCGHFDTNHGPTRAELREVIDADFELLRQIEWSSGDGDEGECPVCGETRNSGPPHPGPHNGHAFDCKLHARIVLRRPCTDCANRA